MSFFIKYIFPVGLFFIIGVFLFSVFRSFAPLYIITLLFLSVFFSLLSIGLNQKSLLLITVITLISFWSGGVITEVKVAKTDQNLNRVLREESAYVISEAKINGNLSRYKVELKDGTKALLTTFLYPKLNYGTEIKINGEIQEPPIFEEFDYRSYLKKEGVDAVIYLPQIETVKTKDFSFKKSIFLFKSKLRSSLHSVLPYPHNTVAGAMVLGDSDRVPEKMKELFSSTGIRHIIAISGMHVTVIAGLLLAFFSSFLGFKRDLCFYLISLFIAFFVFFVGYPASAVRAGVMAIVLLFSFKTGKIYNAPKTLFITAVFMLILNPLLLVYDIGFQLSFLAVLGIIYLTPVFEKLLGRNLSFLKLENKKTSMKESLISLLSVSIGAYLITLPVIVYNFKTVSLLAPITNLVAVPLLPMIIISSFLASVLNFFSNVLGFLMSLPAFLSLETVIRFSKLIEKIPLSSLTVEIDIWWVITAYTLLIFLILFTQFKERLYSPVFNKLSLLFRRVNFFK